MSPADNPNSRALGPLDDEDRRLAHAMGQLHHLMTRLRAVDGCPWDREQSLASLRGYLLEECYELLETLDDDSPRSASIDGHREELGDLLFQAFFQAQIRREQGHFALADAVHDITDKLIRRHPHVFGDVDVTDSQAVKKNWEAIKKTEKPKRGLLDGVPRALPALSQAQRLGDKAAKVGFDWPSIDGVKDKVNEELEELRQALATGDKANVEAELGDLLFSISQYARHLQLDAEDALRGSSRRFRQRLGWMEQRLKAENRAWDACDAQALEDLWQRAKREILGQAEG